MLTANNINKDRMERIVCLGRYGDICNALPLAWGFFKSSGTKPKFYVSSDFASILDGVSYVEPVVLPIRYSQLPKALTKAHGPKTFVCQAYKHPDNRRLTDSYQREAYRLAGRTEDFYVHPLVFDRRSPERELELSAPVSKFPIIALSLGSISSPLHGTEKIEEAIYNEFSSDFLVLRIDKIKAERIFDVLKIIELSKVLVTVDTVHLHLSRATNTPTLAIINDGWFGSVPHAGCFDSIRYSHTTPDVILKLLRNCLKSST